MALSTAWPACSRITLGAEAKRQEVACHCSVRWATWRENQASCLFDQTDPGAAPRSGVCVLVVSGRRINLVKSLGLQELRQADGIPQRQKCTILSTFLY